MIAFRWKKKKKPNSINSFLVLRHISKGLPGYLPKFRAGAPGGAPFPVASPRRMRRIPRGEEPRPPLRTGLAVGKAARGHRGGGRMGTDILPQPGERKEKDAEMRLVAPVWLGF